MTDLYGPDPFMSDADTSGLSVQVAKVIPGAIMNGPIESMKRALIVALREGLQGTNLNLPGISEVVVSMEYPMSKVANPGIWIQFEYTQFQRAGIAHEVIGPVNGVLCPIQEWIFYGRTSLTIVAYSALHRDRISDAVIGNIAFSRLPELTITKPGQNTNMFRHLMAAIQGNPYVFVTLNTDSIIPGGAGMSVGTPWDPNQFVYEDNFTFECVGQFNVAFTHDGAYTLSSIDINPTEEAEPTEPGWSRWI